MRYSLYLVLEKIGGLVAALRNYNGLSDQDVDNILRAYGETLWDKGNDVFFAIESIQNPNTFSRRVASLESPYISVDDDWDVEVSQVAAGMRNNNEFAVYLYAPNQDYINRLDAMIEYLPDGAVLDYAFPETDDEDNSYSED